MFPKSRKQERLVKVPEGAPDGLRDWAAWYFRHAVTTKAGSRHEQARDLSLFIGFMEGLEKGDGRPLWTPRLSAAFRDFMVGRRKGRVAASGATGP